MKSLIVLLVLMALSPMVLADYQESIMVEIKVALDGSATIENMYQSNGFIYQSEFDSSSSAVYEVEILDSQGNMLYSTSFIISLIIDGWDDDEVIDSIALPFFEEASEIVVKNQGEERDRASLDLCDNNGVCDGFENHNSCPGDCSVNAEDGLCISPPGDGLCDPDCLGRADIDCFEEITPLEPAPEVTSPTEKPLTEPAVEETPTQESDPTPIILAVIVLLAIAAFFIIKKRNTVGIDVK